MYSRESEYEVLLLSLKCVIDDFDEVIITESLKTFNGSPKESTFNPSRLQLNSIQASKIKHIVFNPPCFEILKFPSVLRDILFSYNQMLIRGFWAWQNPRLFVRLLRNNVISIDSDECLDAAKIFKLCTTQQDALCTLRLYNCFNKINLIDQSTYYEGPTFKPKNKGHFSIIFDIAKRNLYSMIYVAYKPTISNLRLVFVRIIELLLALVFIYEWRYYGRRKPAIYGIHLNWFGSLRQLEEKVQGYTSHASDIKKDIVDIVETAIEHKFLQWSSDNPKIYLKKVDFTNYQHIPIKLRTFIVERPEFFKDLIVND